MVRSIVANTTQDEVLEDASISKLVVEPKIKSPVQSSFCDEGSYKKDSSNDIIVVENWGLL